MNRVVEPDKLITETKAILKEINKTEPRAFIKGLEAYSAMESMSLEQAVMFLQQRLRDSLMDPFVHNKIEEFFARKEKK